MSEDLFPFVLDLTQATDDARAALLSRFSDAELAYRIADQDRAAALLYGEVPGRYGPTELNPEQVAILQSLRQAEVLPWR